MSGYEVCQRIKGDPQTAAIPVLQISASFISAEDRARALEAGADGYLTHPIDGIVLVATVRALLRLRAAEAEARKSAAQWQTTFDALAEGLALLDSERRILRWNGAFATICGRSFKVGEDGASLLQRMLHTPDPLSQTGAQEFEFGGRTLQLSVNPVGTGGADSEKIVVLSDISDRKLAEYALRTAEKLAATGRLASAIAHEINNPLEALTNLIYLAERSDSVDSIRGLLSLANEELQRIARITKQTLSFHRDTQRPVEIDIGALVVDVAALFERIASTRRVRLVCDLRPAPRICGFPGQLSQVFGNLIRNAAEAGPTGSEVSIRVRTISRTTGTGVRVSIHDRGCGIPDSIKAKIFDPFFTTKDLKGSGLGLWVSKSLIVKHGGTIRFRSHGSPAASGTTFEVFLPVRGLQPQSEIGEQLEQPMPLPKDLQNQY
jgi:signal transduction histidine kinase